MASIYPALLQYHVEAFKCRAMCANHCYQHIHSTTGTHAMEMGILMALTATFGLVV